MFYLISGPLLGSGNRGGARGKSLKRARREIGQESRKKKYMTETGAKMRTMMVTLAIGPITTMIPRWDLGKFSPWNAETAAEGPKIT